MRGLIFSEPMMKAWLEGRKTVTRRLMKPQPTYFKLGPPIFVLQNGKVKDIKAPYRPGETVYIKETWRSWFPTNDDGQPVTGGWCVRYKADGLLRETDVEWDEGPEYLTPFDCGIDKEPSKWKSPRFMPEWAARSHALIKSVRPERVQEITTRECVHEGMVCGSILDDNNEDVLREVRESKSCLVAAALLKTSGIPPRKQFIAPWESLHPGSWDRNDFVWRIELKKQEGKNGNQ